MDKQQTALQIRGSVLEFRGVHSETWKTPSDIRCLQFAVTECGEALDEYIRLDAQWFRTNPREAGREEVLLELADCLMMLLSISGKDEKQYEWFSFSDWSGENEINDEFFADLLIRMSNALSYYVAYKQVPFWFVYSAVSIILAIDEDWPFRTPSGRWKRAWARCSPCSPDDRRKNAKGYGRPILQDSPPVS